MDQKRNKNKKNNKDLNLFREVKINKLIIYFKMKVYLCLHKIIKNLI